MLFFIENPEIFLTIFLIVYVVVSFLDLDYFYIIYHQ